MLSSVAGSRLLRIIGRKLKIVLIFLPLSIILYLYLLIVSVLPKKKKSNGPKFVAVVLSYKRTINLPFVVYGLLKQSYIDEIHIFHNHPSWLYMPGCKNIFSTSNLGSIVRHDYAHKISADFDYFLFTDDDLMFRADLGPQILNTIYKLGEKSVLGFYGHILNFNKGATPYTSGSHTEPNNEVQKVDVVKGRVHFISKLGIEILAKFKEDSPAFRSEDDIRASLILKSVFGEANYLLPCTDPIFELPSPYALFDRKDHLIRRNLAVLHAKEKLKIN